MKVYLKHDLPFFCLWFSFPHKDAIENPTPPLSEALYPPPPRSSRSILGFPKTKRQLSGSPSCCYEKAKGRLVRNGVLQRMRHKINQILPPQASPTTNDLPNTRNPPPTSSPIHFLTRITNSLSSKDQHFSLRTLTSS